MCESETKPATINEDTEDGGEHRDVSDEETLRDFTQDDDLLKNPDDDLLKEQDDTQSDT